MLGRDLHLDRLLGREPDLPRYLGGCSVQILFAAVLAVGELHQHALGQTAMQVQQHGVTPGGGGQHAAPAREQVFALQAGEGVHFGGQKILNASGAGEKELELVHRVFLRFVGAILSPSRYLATVRRAHSMPCSCSISAIF